MTGRHARPRWIADRIPVTEDMRLGYHKIHGCPWTTWAFVAWRWEYYVARRDPEPCREHGKEQR